MPSDNVKSEVRSPKSETTAFVHRSDTVEAYTASVERVIRHMMAHLDEPLDLDQLARIAAISKFHLVRVFDELTGTTPGHFLSCLRMQRAKELMRRGGFKGYTIVEYTEGLESSVLGSQRVTQGVIQLTRKAG